MTSTDLSLMAALESLTSFVKEGPLGSRNSGIKIILQREIDRHVKKVNHRGGGREHKCHVWKKSRCVSVFRWGVYLVILVGAGRQSGRQWSSEREWCNYVVSGTSRNGLTSVFWHKSRSPTGICRCRPLRVSRSIFHPPGSPSSLFPGKIRTNQGRKGRVANYVRDRPPVLHQKRKKKKLHLTLLPFVQPTTFRRDRLVEDTL